jgi:hypothetical protein
MHRTCLAVLLSLASGAVAAACTAHSDAQRPHLVELYTSEGCDSCPPAERWMSTLRKHADLIGLEFHVDYWDTSDWRDPFSDHAYTLRQQALADRANRGQIFTPQIWLDGQLWKNWPKAPPPALATAAAPALRLSAGGNPLDVQVDLDGGGAGDYRIYAAISETGLSENVRGGENRGKTLRHDEVVRAFAGPARAPAQLRLSVAQRVDPAHAAIVAFVENADDGSIVQALRVPLQECTK